MSNQLNGQAPTPHTPQDEPSKGPNLVLIYSLIALALVAAIAVALMIVFPFYLRR